ncbi:hypothetical protein [Microtetraspora malaysiensis]|uniref:hypothetical protein n=1 Tax=Microtetraspora malaysiensis TaxID=161358 RepID=UPI003D907D55
MQEATRHFQLAIPAQADDLRFASDKHPVSGEYSLTLEFTTTPMGLQAFLNSSHLPQPEPDDDAQPIDQYASCGLTDGDFNRPAYADEERQSSIYVRRLAVDRANPARPRAIVEATDT